MTKEKCILMAGSTFTVPESERRERPRLTLYPPSLNSQKAHACLRFSSLDYNKVDINIVNYPEDNQKLDYARLNPNMTIPTLEIDDKVITDSRDIQKYLTEKYPGKGDAAAKKEDIDSFLDTVCAWDEYLFSYRRIPRTLGDGAHNIRLVCQVESVNQAIQEGVMDEVLRDGQTMREAYVKKIAQTRALVNVGVGVETPELAERIKENDKLLENIFEAASALLKMSGGPLLLGSDLTSADAFFATVLARLEMTDIPLKKSLFDRFEGTREWWDCFQKQDEADVILKYDKAWTMSTMFFSGKPLKILGYKLGLYVPGKLPEHMESDVQAELARLEKAYLE